MKTLKGNVECTGQGRKVSLSMIKSPKIIWGNEM
jgi:hypothetical protein